MPLTLQIFTAELAPNLSSGAHAFGNHAPVHDLFGVDC